MALTNVLLLSQIAGHVIGLILSLCIVVPMSLHQDEFRGHCLLFSVGEWQETDAQLKVAWASQAYCNYVIFVGVALFIVCVVQIYRLSVLMYKGVDGSFLSAFLDVVSSLLLALLIMVAALMVTLGFSIWCRTLTQRFTSCEIAAGQDIDREDKISTDRFYIEMGTVQLGVWGAFATWVGLAVFALLKLCRFHQLENIRVSMYRERRRLISDGGSPTGSLARDAADSTPPGTMPPGSVPPSLQYGAVEQRP